MVGLLTAYMLSRRGFETVVVAGGDVRRSASWGNAGYLAAGFGSPIPAAESISQIVKWMLSRMSPIKVSPKFFIKETTRNGWLTKYLKNKGRTSTMEYAKLVRRACLEGMYLLKKVIEEHKLETELRSDGILEVYLNERELGHHLEKLEEARELEIEFKHLDRKECLENNPLLSKNIVGGILFKEDLALHPSKLMLSLRKALAEQFGVPVIDQEVVRMVVDGDSVSSVTLSNGSSLKASYYVVCAGVNTGRLFSQLNITIPMVSGYGYMIMTEPTTEKLRYPTVGGEFRAAASQTAEGNLRVTGFFELRHGASQPVEKRCEFLKKVAARYIPAFGELNLVEKWVGARPCTPDGLPLVGKIVYDNLFVAAGHCRLGLTMAASTAKHVTDLLTGAENPFTPYFDPRRYLVKP